MTFDGRKAAALLTLVFGFAAATAAVPQAVSALSLAPGGPVLAALGRGDKVSVARIQQAAAGRQVALAWYETPSAWAELGALKLALARDGSLTPRVRSALLDQAVTAFRSGLALGPVQPYAWTQYAYAVLARDEGRGRIDVPLLMSATTAPEEPPLVMQRIELGFIAYRVLGEAARAMLRDQVHIVARANTATLARFAHDNFALAWVRQALSGDGALRRRFDLAYLRLNRL